MYAVALMSQIYTTNRKNELGVPEVRRDIQINGTKKKAKNNKKTKKKTKKNHQYKKVKQSRTSKSRAARSLTNTWKFVQVINWERFKLFRSH